MGSGTGFLLLLHELCAAQLLLLLPARPHLHPPHTEAHGHREHNRTVAEQSLHTCGHLLGMAWATSLCVRRARSAGGASGVGSAAMHGCSRATC